MGLERVVFPHELPTWGHVRGLLLELQEGLLNETVSAEDVTLHIQIIVDAIKTTHCLDQTWLRSKHDLAIGGAKMGARQKVDQYHIWHGMLQFLMETDHEEKEKFLFSTLPNLIELVIRAEDHMPPKELSFSRQQKGGTTVLTRQFVASILACSFLCLFPERTHDKASKLNSINFTHFFKLLPQPSQVAKLRCILCYFEQIIKAGMEIAGSITFRRQVAEKTALPSVEDLVKSNVALCPLVVHLEGGIEDADSNAIQVNFADRSIGGGVLGQGKEQEEIRFCTCPELIAALLFVENIEDNEAIIITGFEQFSQCRGYGGLLEYEGPYKIKAEKEPGNVHNTVCIIEAMPYSWGGHKRQYLQSFILKEISKVFVGFCWVKTFRPQPLHAVARCTSSDREEDFMTAPENMDDEDASEEVGKLAQMAHTMSYHLLSQGLVEAMHIMSSLDKKLKLPSISAEDSLGRGDLSPFGLTPPGGGRGQSCSTPQDEPAQVVREELASTPSHGRGGNGECLSLPVLVRLPQNGSCDLLEVDYSEWLANFRRRSSQLSDLTSRRSSSSTKQSSELSSDLEEIYENLVQAEKLQHGIIEEEYYGSAVSDYAAQFVDSLMNEGTSIAAQMLPGMRHFDQMTPLEGVHRPMAVRFAGSGVLCNFTAAAEDENGEDNDLDFGVNVEAVGSNRMQFHTFSIPEFAQSVVESAVRCGTSEASLCLLAREVDRKPDRRPDDIPDDVYRWFADKIVQEVFAHVVDELYFQRFTSESCWRTDLCVNREGMPRRPDQIERTESMSSNSSISSCIGSADLPNKSLRSSAFQTFTPESVHKPEGESLEDRSSLGSGYEERPSVSKTVRLGDMPEPWPSEVGKKMPACIKFSGKVVEDEAAKSSLTANVCSIPPTSPKVSGTSPQVQQLWFAQFSAEEQNSTIVQSWLPGHDGGSLCSEETGALKSPLISAQGVLPNREMSVETPVALKSTVASASLQTLTDDSGAVGTTFSCESQTSATDQSSSLSAQDLNLDYYKMAATIVNQVFQSLPDYINKMAEAEKGSGPRSLLYSFHGRKYDSSIAPRSSYEAAAMAIGSLDKGNVVRESYLSAVSGTSGASGDVGSRRTRSQSPSKTWLSKRLSRETLTNAFLRAENKPAVKSYERRSSEPCQRSVTLSLQAYGSCCHGSERSEDRRHKKSHTDDDLETVKADSWRRSSLDSIPLDRRRSSCGFKDPVLSRFAQELMNADISVPQLFLVGSGSSPSTTGSRRSSVSGFRDTTLATFESELLNSSFGQTLPSPRLRYPNFSQSRESRLWKSDSSETEYWFPIPRRVGTEFQEELERINRCQSVDEVEDYADFVATTILQQAVSILHHDMKEVTQEDEDISIFSENLADQILREGLVAAVETSSTGRSVKFSRSVSGSEQDFSLSSHDLTSHSYDDHLLDFCDALDVPYICVDSFAANLAQSIMFSVMEQFGEVLKRFVPYGRPIATGNWDWKGFHGDPFLKMLIQWIAASIAQAPQMIYFTFGDERLNQMHALVRLLNEQNWTVGQLMTSIQAYCLVVLDEMDLWEKDTDALATSDVDRFIPSQTLFDFLLCQL